MGWVEFEGSQFTEDMAKRLAWAVAQIRKDGGNIRIDEGLRLPGIPSDQYVTDASKTSTGGSNGWFQWGRAQRGETPSASYPGTGDHSIGIAVDCDTDSMDLRSKYFGMVGLVQTIASESWHWAIRNAPTVDISGALIDKGENLMQIAWDTNGTGYLVTEIGIGALGSMQYVDLFRRVIAGESTFHPVEIQMLDQYQRTLAKSVTAGIPIDQAKLASAIVDALRAQNDSNATLIANKIAASPLKFEAVTGVDPEVLAKSLNTALDAAVPRVAAAIVKQAGTKLGS